MERFLDPTALPGLSTRPQESGDRRSSKTLQKCNEKMEHKRLDLKDLSQLMSKDFPQQSKAIAA